MPKRAWPHPTAGQSSRAERERIFAAAAPHAAKHPPRRRPVAYADLPALFDLAWAETQIFPDGLIDEIRPDQRFWEVSCDSCFTRLTIIRESDGEFTAWPLPPGKAPDRARYIAAFTGFPDTGFVVRVIDRTKPRPAGTDADGSLRQTDPTTPRHSRERHLPRDPIPSPDGTVMIPGFPPTYANPLPAVVSIAIKLPAWLWCPACERRLFRIEPPA